MIPKIIHYVWLNEKPLQERFEDNIRTWIKFMPEYQIMKWDLANKDKTFYNIPFIKEAIKRKRYAAASNYIRLLALEIYGGIYFDIDMEVIKSFNPLLDNSFFAAAEKPHRVNNAVMGAESGNKIILEMLYNTIVWDFDRHHSQGIEIETSPQLMTNTAKLHGWKEKDEIQELDNGGIIYDSSYFYPYYFDEAFTPECIKPTTYAIHQWSKLW